MKPFAFAIAGMMLAVSHSQADQWREPVEAGYRLDKGRPMPNRRFYKSIIDYRHYGLREPGAGQQWLRVDNHFVLLNTTTGVILSMARI
ncbi:RcnB family protein [Rhizobium grahamii]|uniref:Uncharacterized protein n=2 Tax=Rhizobium grahamii TaxID=1120045 RepID=S3H9H5_9HYPH|nr:RcnB family protein [Rhizobium grahamii]EPE94855.1 hypothetical protein RGCCGE502_30153 [Rhizobium grahamii CCGE 502]RDJ05641.1 hypothetical protein B5K06_24620 [Rhizobium grahamii]